MQGSLLGLLVQGIPFVGVCILKHAKWLVAGLLKKRFVPF